MMKFSQIRKQRLDEDVESPVYSTSSSRLPYNDGAVDGIDASVFDVGKPESIQRLNAFLSTFSGKRYIDPNYALKQVQTKLGIVGLNFTYHPTRPYKFDTGSGASTSISAPSGAPSTFLSIDTETFPLTYMGGRYGVLDDKYTVGTDDGISHRLGKPLSLKVQYSVFNNGLVNIIPTIV